MQILGILIVVQFVIQMKFVATAASQLFTEQISHSK